MTANPDFDAEKLIEYHKAECARYVNGRCTTHRCMMRGGFVPGAPDLQNVATCEAHETVLALSRHPAGEVGLALPRGLMERLRTCSATPADMIAAADALTALSAPVDAEVEKLAKEAEDGAGRFLKWTYNQDYDGPPVISIPRHDGNIDALLERLAARLRTLSRQLATERQAWAKAMAEIEAYRDGVVAKGPDDPEYIMGIKDGSSAAYARSAAILAQHTGQPVADTECEQCGATEDQQWEPGRPCPVCHNEVEGDDGVSYSRLPAPTGQGEG